MENGAAENWEKFCCYTPGVLLFLLLVFFSARHCVALYIMNGESRRDVVT